jgi:hypothetical protein
MKGLKSLGNRRVNPYPSSQFLGVTLYYQLWRFPQDGDAVERSGRGIAADRDQEPAL